MSVADLKVRISANSDAFDSAMKKMQRSFNKNVRKMEQTGKNLTQKVTLPILGIAAAAGKTAIDFESAFAGVRKTVDATEAEFAGLRKGILDMSKTLPTSADEIAGVAEAAGQLGISTENILEFSKTMVMLGDSTNLTADEAATSFARIANVMQLPQDQFDEMGSVVVDLGNNFATTEAEIVEFGNRIAGAGKIAGLNASQVFAIGTALSSVGIQAESGGTAVQKALLSMNDAVTRGGETLQVFAETAGMTAEQFQRRWRDDAGAAFTEFVNGLGRSGDGATQILDDVGLNSERTRAAFLSLAGAGDLLTRTMDVGNDAWLENSALTKEAQQRYKTIASRIEMVKNRMIALGISIGDALMPAFEKVIEFTENLTEAFEDLSADAKVNALKIAALFAASGPLMWAIAQFAKAIQGLVLFIKSKFLLITLAFAAGVGIGQSFLDNWEKVTAGFEMNMRNMEQAATYGVIGVIKAFKAWFNFVTSFAPPEFLTAIFGIDLSEMAMDMAGVNSLIQKLEGNIESNGKDLKDAMVRYYENPWVSFYESTKTGIGAVTVAFTDMVKDLTSDTALADFLDLIGGSFEYTADKAVESAARIEKSMKAIGTKTFEGATIGSTPEAPQIGEPKEFLGIGESTMNLLDQLRTDEFYEGINAMQRQAESFARTMEGVLENAITSFASGIGRLAAGASSMKDVAVGLINVLSDMMIQIGSLWISFGTGWAAAMNPATLFATAGTSAIVAGAALVAAGAGLKAIFSDASSRDIGGPVSAGSPYMIGKGPHRELFVPDRSGSIIGPNRLRGSGGGSGKQVIENMLHLDGQVVWRNQKSINHRKRR